MIYKIKILPNINIKNKNKILPNINIKNKNKMNNKDINYEEINSKLVIVCHCSKPVENDHKKLYYVLQYFKIHFKTNEAFVLKKSVIPLGKEVSYVNEIDKRCPETDKWANIADNSKTYVWGVSCPIYYTLLQNETDSSSSNKTLTDILLNAYRVLTHDGKVIFTCPVIRDKDVKGDTNSNAEITEQEYVNSVSIITANTQAFMKSDDDNNLSSKYILSIIKTKEHKFLIGKYHNNGETAVNGTMYIFDLCVIFTKIDVLNGGMSAKKRNNTQKNNKKHTKTKHKIIKHKKQKHKTQNKKTLK